ncbi:hypothetical protein, partial [Pseudomonas syringae pv. coryli]|uniref:hypothetical protein n=1 Tax=Pseudomonas syringae pv. coryli TaxID=317659 RepID=UPI001C3F1814
FIHVLRVPKVIWLLSGAVVPRRSSLITQYMFQLSGFQERTQFAHHGGAETHTDALIHSNSMMDRPRLMHK